MQRWQQEVVMLPRVFLELSMVFATYENLWRIISCLDIFWDYFADLLEEVAHLPL